MGGRNVKQDVIASTANKIDKFPGILLAMEYCKGGGDCIVSKNVDGYEMICNHNCKPRACPNVLVCNSTQENSIMVVGSDLCFSCDVTFAKKLTFLEKTDCQICPSKDTQGVKRLNCDHSLCLTCFKRAHYGDPPTQPSFPYGKDIEMDYTENRWDTKWLDDPLIRQYEVEYEGWVDKLYENFKECDPLRECKVCTT